LGRVAGLEDPTQTLSVDQIEELGLDGTARQL
jgi:hypothetical protein